MITVNNIEKRFFVKIRFIKDSKNSCLAPTVYYRTNMSFQFFIKWKWYFEYRKALLIVKYPRAFVDMTSGSFDYELPIDKYKEKLRNLLTASKRQVTQFQRDITNAKKQWTEFLPIEEHPKWVKVQEKLNRYITERDILQKEYTNLLMGKDKEQKNLPVSASDKLNNIVKTW